VSQAIKDANWDIQKAITVLAQSEGISVQELLNKLDINKMTGLGFVLLMIDVEKLLKVINSIVKSKNKLDSFNDWNIKEKTNSRNK